MNRILTKTFWESPDSIDNTINRWTSKNRIAIHSLKQSVYCAGADKVLVIITVLYKNK